MNFNPIDFLQLARQLYKDRDYIQIQQAAYRTSISRIYYAVFLLLRELISEKAVETSLAMEYSTIAKSGRIHSFIKKSLERSDRYLGKIYGSLFLKRKHADYEMEKEFYAKDIEEALKISEEIMNKKDKIEKSLTPQIISIIILDYLNNPRNKN